MEGMEHGWWEVWLQQSSKTQRMREKNRNLFCRGINISKNWTTTRKRLGHWGDQSFGGYEAKIAWRSAVSWKGMASIHRTMTHKSFCFLIAHLINHYSRNAGPGTWIRVPVALSLSTLHCTGIIYCIELACFQASARNFKHSICSNRYVQKEEEKERGPTELLKSMNAL